MKRFGKSMIDPSTLDIDQHGRVALAYSKAT
jgi:hypothetical protein